jgi:hypothetical protein
MTMKTVKSSYVRKHLAKVFGGIVNDLTIIEADFKMMVTPTAQHFRKGRPGDPFHCPLALANRDEHGCKVTAVYNTSAYMDLPCADGERRIHRFLVPRATSEAIHAVDKRRRRKLKPGTVYFFNPVSKSTTLEASYLRGKKSNRARNQQARRTVVRAAAYERTARDAQAALDGVRERVKRLKMTEKPASERLRMAQAMLDAAKSRAQEATDIAHEWRVKADAVKSHAHTISAPKSMERAGAWTKVSGNPALVF